MTRSVAVQQPRATALDRQKVSSPARVLVIEDERIVAADLQRMLRELGYDAYAAVASASHALGVSRRTPPDIALTDIRIDGALDGVDTAIDLHERYGVGIIFLTAHADDLTVDRAKAAEPYGYLLKPVTPPALKAAIELALSRRARNAQLQLQTIALAQTSECLSGVLDHLPVAVQFEDEQCRIRHVNQRFCSLFDVKSAPPDLAGTDGMALMRHIQSLCVAQEEFSAMLDCTRRVQQPILGALLMLNDGRKVERDYIPVFRGEARCGQLWAYRDVTEREQERTRLEQSEERHSRAVITDELTGLNNRRGFFQLAHTYVRVVRRPGHAKILFFVDLNSLKTINDEFGHAAGDEALCEVARALRDTFRQSDLIARLGGDEFVVLATMPPGETEAVRTRLLARLEDFNATAGRPYRVCASLGATEYVAGESLEELVSRADEAMYRDKHVRREAGRS